MKIKFLKLWEGYGIGYVLQLKANEHTLGESLIGRGIAERFEEPKAEPKAKPKEPVEVETTAVEPGAENAQQPAPPKRKGKSKLEAKIAANAEAALASGNQKPKGATE